MGLEAVFSKTDLALYLGIGILCSGLGTLLGIKYAHFKRGFYRFSAGKKSMDIWRYWSYPSILS